MHSANFLPRDPRAPPLKNIRLLLRAEALTKATLVQYYLQGLRATNFNELLIYGEKMPSYLTTNTRHPYWKPAYFYLVFFDASGLRAKFLPLLLAFFWKAA